jgi:hypothetical protein
VQHSEYLADLAAAMAAAQAEMKAAEMNATNPFLKNRYADLGSIIEAVRPAIGKHGLSFAQMPTFDGQTVTVETLIMHASGQWLASNISLSIEGEKGLSQAQVMGKAITYLRRYGLSAMFGVYADKDEDGNDDPKHAQPRAEQPTPAATGPVPNCPKCNGAMWDNREKKTNPKAPDFKCKNKECDGAVWPPKDSGNGAAHGESVSADSKTTDAQIKKIHTICGKLYKTPEQVATYRAWLKQNWNVDSSKDLTVVEASKVIELLSAEEARAEVAA